MPALIGILLKALEIWNILQYGMPYFIDRCIQNKTDLFFIGYQSVATEFVALGCPKASIGCLYSLLPVSWAFESSLHSQASVFSFTAPGQSAGKGRNINGIEFANAF